ncbi:monooxygenase [Paenibacillus sp. J31TS4]|uniref:putative quinol monooxygenase n=1 Tax=Paenibacillus sp. J31TS4 TaxID=2807195 RepID=UPI001B1EC58B|nr:antibiotic biosynthesis monooxygenase [Paenibacillus sp. J31TS4]GIP38367.1 monooxygenase [Paenibacillus sp. J31TS4]
MNKYGLFVQFTTHPGQRDALAALLLEAAAAAQDIAECELYLVSVPESEPDCVYVTEVWSHKEAHDASLEAEETRASIQRAMPLIAGVASQTLIPLGGKGL